MQNQVRGLGGNLECVVVCVATVSRKKPQIDVVLVAIISVKLSRSPLSELDYSMRNLFSGTKRFLQRF